MSTDVALCPGKVFTKAVYAMFKDDTNKRKAGLALISSWLKASTAHRTKDYVVWQRHLLRATPCLQPLAL